MKRLVLLLLVLMAVVGAVSATNIPIFHNATHESPLGNITEAHITGDTMYVSWENIPPLGEYDQPGVINLYCPDSGFPYWGGMAYGPNGGTWSFTLQEIGLSGVDGCWFDLIDGTWGMK